MTAPIAAIAAAERATVSLGDGRVLVRTDGGLTLLASTADLVALARITFDGCAIGHAVAGVAGVIAEGRAVVCVGAGMGEALCAIGRDRTGAPNRLIAIEPHPALVPLLRTNLELNAGTLPFEVIEVAVSNMRGRGRLATHPERAAASTLLADLPLALAAEIAVGEEVEVAVETLDNLLPDPREIGLLLVPNLDRHLNLFHGAARTLRGADPLAVVIGFAAAADTVRAQCRRAALAPLIAAGYRPVDPAQADLDALVTGRGVAPFARRA